MNANKVTVTIEVQALSIDSVPSLIAHATEQIDREMTNGKLVADDGDQVSWFTTITPVQF